MEMHSRNVLWRYYINWSLTIPLGIYAIIGYVMPIPSLLAYVTTSPDAPCGTPGLGDSETIYSVASSMFNGGSMTGAILVAILTKRIGYKAIMLIGPISQVLGFCIHGSSVAGWMVAVARGFTGVNYGATVAVVMSYFSVSTIEYNKLAASLSKPENPNIKKRLMIAFFAISGLGYVIGTGAIAIVEQFFEYPQINQFRWIAWFQIAVGVVVVTLHLLLFYNTDDYFQCGSKPEASEEEDYKEVTKPSTSLADKLAIIYLLCAGAVTDVSITIVDTLAAILLTDHFGMTVKYISYVFLGVAQMYHIPIWILLLLNKFNIKSQVVLFMSLMLATIGCLIMIDWPYIYTNNSCKDYSINEPVQLATTSESICDISSLCYPLDIPRHSLPFYIKPNNSTEDNIVYSVTYEHICRVSKLDITSTSASCYISCTSDPLNINECKINNNTCDFDRHSKYSNNTIICYITNVILADDTNQDRDICGEYWPFVQDPMHMNLSNVFNMLFNSTNGDEEYATTLSGLEYIDSVAKKEMHCEEDENCYWNPDSIVTGEYCFNCPTLCLKKNGLHFSQVIIALLIFLFAAEIGRTTLFPIMSKLSPKHIQPFTTSVLVFVQDLSRLVTPLWAVEVYLSTGRNTYPIIGTVIGLLVPISVGFIILNCYLYHKKRSSEKKEVRKHRPSIAELLPSQHDNGTCIEGHTNKLAFEVGTNDTISSIGINNGSSSSPVFVTPL